MWSLLAPGIPFRINSGTIISAYRKLELASGTANESVFSISSYEGNDPGVLAIRSYLERHLSNDLVAGLVHGSLATGEKVNYSDFDGLVILKNEVFESASRAARVAMHLSRSYALMTGCDPLQHHGWFVVTEKELHEWPVNFFPVEIFEYTRGLVPGRLDLKIRYAVTDHLALASFLRLADSIQRKLMAGIIPKNAYQLKGLLSEFMLLPALYLQSKNGSGIYKKYSFEAASVDFPPQTWEIMHKVTAIRERWPEYSVSPAPSGHELVTPRFKERQLDSAQAVPASLLGMSDDVLIREMQQLITAMKNKLA